VAFDMRENIGMVRTGILAVVLVLSTPSFSFAQEHRHELGTVRFEISCSGAAQQAFLRGLALLHSFWYDEAGKAFSKVLAADPSCAMGYWGIAMSLYHPIWSPPPEADLVKGRAAIEKAESVGAKTQRERDYIGALQVFYRDSEKVPHSSRALAWQHAMKALASRYPADSEASVFYALALLGTAPATDKTYSNQKQAAAILNRVLQAHPDHPGVAHYIIHSYDSPQLARLALPAARAYAAIAPAAPHALHMPSHIFTRLGMWQESISSNVASASAARKHAMAASPGATSQDELHAMDYLVYAYLQIGEDQEGKHIVEQATAVTSVDQEVFQAAYGLAAIPARFALERRRWSEAAELQVRPSAFPWLHFPYAEAITHFARALGTARIGNLSIARAEIAKLASIRQTLKPVEGSYDWGTQVEIQHRSALAWLAHAEGNNEAALHWMRSAADLEDRSDKHPVTPGAVLPARELLAELLMELDRPALAGNEFETVLRSSPGRFNAIYGAARAAELAGNRNRARQHYSELVQLCRGDGVMRMEVQTAKAFLGR
jgi:tetratricopeptide (TPR) repeat protein